MSSLHDLQVRHVRCTARLITFAESQGLELTWGETYRTPEQAILNAQAGRGIVHSLHTIRLAVDLQAFRNGQYLTKSSDYQGMGDFWKKLDPAARWGGDFMGVNPENPTGPLIPKPDGNHFSMEWMGVK